MTALCIVLSCCVYAILTLDFVEVLSRQNGTVSRKEKQIMMKIIKEAAVDYLMPLVVLWRWFRAPEGVVVISIERPWH